VTCFESHVPAVAFPGQRTRKFRGNTVLKARILGKAQAKETKLVQIGVSFEILP
jgi:hypothetical protein